MERGKTLPSTGIFRNSKLLRNWRVGVASLFYVGFIPYAPGTFGTLLAVGFVMVFKPGMVFLFILLLFVFTLGLYVSDRAERLFGEKDSRHIVIDEFVGYFVSIYGIVTDPAVLIICFLVFRFFDIVKPFPIKRLERGLRGGFAIMMDDIVAGLYTNIAIRILLKLTG